MTEPKTELQKNAYESARLKKQKLYQRALDIQWLNSRMEDSRMGRCIAQIQREAEMEREFQERTDHAAIVNARAEKETALGLAIINEHNEQVCKMLKRMHLRERDPELRELTKKLTAGYVCRDLKQQILHNQYKKLQEKAEEKKANDLLASALYLDKEAFDKELQEEAERARKYCLELQQQLVNRQTQKQCEYEDSLIERKMLEDIMRTIADEDQRELKQKHEQMLKFRTESETFRKVRAAWKEKHRQMVIQEERKIEEQAKRDSDRKADNAADRQRKMRERELQNEKIAEKIMADEAEKQERENIIRNLLEQEYLEKNYQDDIAEKAKLEKTKNDTKTTLTEQIETKKRMVQEEKKKEEAYRKSVEEAMQTEDEKLRQREIQQREKKKKYILELREQIATNAKRKEEEKKIEEQRVENVWAYQKDMLDEVSQERANIIEAHVPHVLGYIQAGVLRRADVPAVCRGAERMRGLRGADVARLLQPGRHAAARPKCNAQCRALREN